MTSSSDILARVRRVEMRTRKLANDLMVGAYHSQFKGRGMDFEELREYIPGDDVRMIDWNVTARMRRPFVKLHREERELAVMIVLDISASEEFGSGQQSKREYATEVAATLAYSALRNGDKVGLLLFTERTELLMPPKKGRKHLLRIIREALAFPAKHRGTNIRSALSVVNHVLHRRTVVFLLSDFLHMPESAEGDLFSDRVNGKLLRYSVYIKCNESCLLTRLVFLYYIFCDTIVYGVLFLNAALNALPSSSPAFFRFCSTSFQRSLFSASCLSFSADTLSSSSFTSNSCRSLSLASLNSTRKSSTRLPKFLNDFSALPSSLGSIGLIFLYNIIKIMVSILKCFLDLNGFVPLNEVLSP
jgi:hypothetical protein